MTVGEVIRTPEERAMGLLFKLGHSLTSRDAVERGGATIVGTGTTFGPDGMTLNSSGSLSYLTDISSKFGSSITAVIEFTFGFVPGDGIRRYIVYIDDLSSTKRFYISQLPTNALAVVVGNTTVLNCVSATWLPVVVPGKNVLITSCVSGVNYLWLNGTLVASSATAWSAKPGTTVFNIGSSGGASNTWIGTISRFEIYGNVSTAVDEPYLRQGTLISALNDPLAVLPGTSYYKNDAGLYVTDVGGRIGGTALMGSDGATAAQFPSIIRPRGFSFDGGDQINLGDSDALSFTDGVSDKPFSIAAIIGPTQFGITNIVLFGKGNAVNNVREYVLWGNNANTVITLKDETLGGYIGRISSIGLNRDSGVLIVTYSGSGVASGISLYLNTVRRDAANYSEGSYSCMRNTAETFGWGKFILRHGTYFKGSIVLPIIDDKEWSPLQVKAITARLLRLARTGG